MAKKYDFSAFDNHPANKYDFNAFDSHPAIAKEEEIPEIQSLAEGAAEGATASLKPMLAGGAHTAMDVITGITNPKDILERYRQYRDAEVKGQEKAKEANPMSYGAGQMAGAVLPAIATGGASAEATALPLAGQGLEDLSMYQQLLAKVSPEVAGAANVGAKYGATQAFGGSKADLTKGEVGPLVKDVAEGGTIGGMTGALMQGLMPKLPTLEGSADALDTMAAKRAIKASGGTAGERKQLLKSDRFLEHGKNLLEKNEYQDKPLVSALSKPGDILERSQDLLEKSGQAIGGIQDKLDEAGIKAFNPQDVVQKIQEAQKDFMIGDAINPLAERQYNMLEKAKEALSHFGNAPVDFQSAAKIKKMISDVAYGDKGTIEDEVMAKIRGIVNKQLEEATDKGAMALGQPEVQQQYLRAKDLYRTAKDAERMSLGEQARKLGHKDMGITDTTAAAAATLAHGTPAGLATFGVKKTAETYGNSLAATTAKQTANVMRSINKRLTSSPETLKSVGAKLSGSQSPLNQSLGKILTEASSKDEIGRNALIFSLMQNDKYRDLMKQELNGDEE